MKTPELFLQFYKWKLVIIHGTLIVKCGKI
jgi:hypothetical protein